MSHCGHIFQNSGSISKHLESRVDFLTPVPLELCISPTWLPRTWKFDPPWKRSPTLMMWWVVELPLDWQNNADKMKALMNIQPPIEYIPPPLMPDWIPCPTFCFQLKWWLLVICKKYMLHLSSWPSSWDTDKAISNYFKKSMVATCFQQGSFLSGIRMIHWVLFTWDQKKIFHIFCINLKQGLGFIIGTIKYAFIKLLIACLDSSMIQDLEWLFIWHKALCR